MRSQNRIRMSLKSSRRIGELNSRKLCQRVQCSSGAFSSFGSSRICRCTKIVAPDRTIESTSAIRTPPMTPNRSINSPPKNGAIMIGRRLITDWTPMPIEWRFASSAAATSEKVAGNEKHAAGIGVERAQQCAKRVVESDDENCGAKLLEVLRDESHPKFFARADHENREQQNDEVALESEKTRDSRKPDILRLALRFLVRRWRI